MVKSWNIWDFPDKINIILKNEIHEEFFNYMFQKFGGKRPYARFLGIYQNHVKNMHKGYSKNKEKIYNFYTPNWVFKKSLHLLNNNLKRKIENNIIAIKCMSTGNKVFNPKLPIKESPALYRIVAHLLGDGFAGKRKVPYYANTCKELREQFKTDLKIFGDLESYERTPNTTPCLHFPKVISDILKHILDIEFTRPNKLPQNIFNASKECKKEFVKAFFDDEGTISTNLAIGMNNLNLMGEIKTLVESLDIQTNKISKGKSSSGGICYYFSIPKKEILKFKDNLGFDHPIKLERLKLWLKIKERNQTQRTRPLEWSRCEILRLLKEKPMTTFDLSKELLLTINGIYLHLNFLKNSEMITCKGFKNKKIWYLV